jgi:hypothetical protein
LDVSIKETSVCVIDGTGRVVREVKVPTEPEAIFAVLSDEDFNIKRIGSWASASSSPTSVVAQSVDSAAASGPRVWPRSQAYLSFILGCSLAKSRSM